MSKQHPLTDWMHKLARRQPVRLVGPLGGFDQKTAKALVAELAPELADKPVSLIRDYHGSTVVKVGDSHILKAFAPNHWRYTGEGVAREMLVQKLLADRLGECIPQVRAISTTHHAMIMECASGVPLETLPRLTGDKATRLQSDLRRFLTQSRKAVTAEEAKALGLPRTSFALWHKRQELPVPRQLSDKLAEVQDELPAESRNALSRFIAAYQAEWQDLSRTGLVHADLEGHNLFVDPKTGGLTQVIDFGAMEYCNGIDRLHSLSCHMDKRPDMATALTARNRHQIALAEAAERLDRALNLGLLPSLEESEHLAKLSSRPVAGPGPWSYLAGRYQPNLAATASALSRALKPGL